MSKFTIDSKPCKFEVGCFSYHLCAPSIVSRTVEVKTCADLEREIAAVHAEAKAIHPGQFFTCEVLARGSRAPRGYNAKSFDLREERREAA